MCIFASSVHDVAGTSILVARGGASQLTVYQMTVALNQGKPNAMILPVPGQVESLVDLSAVPKFFVELSELFSERSRGMKSLGGAVAAGMLPVHEVGDYQVSIVPSVEDLVRLDTSVFELSSRTRSTCKVYYKTGFSFVVAVLRRSGKIHPLAYTHPFSEEAGLFVPTRHEHGEAGPPGSLPVWDHEIYFQGPATAPSRPVRSGPEKYRQATAGPTLLELRLAAPVLKPYLRFEEPVSRLSYYGRYENRDLHLKA